jgi:flagellar biogenesis protein FliO
VLGVLAAALWWLRRKGAAQFTLRGLRRGGGPRRLEVLERLSLTPQHSLHLVRVADRVVLIALSPAGCSILDGATPREEVFR